MPKYQINYVHESRGRADPAKGTALVDAESAWQATENFKSIYTQINDVKPGDTLTVNADLHIGGMSRLALLVTLRQLTKEELSELLKDVAYGE